MSCSPGLGETREGCIEEVTCLLALEGAERGNLHGRERTLLQGRETGQQRQESQKVGGVCRGLGGRGQGGGRSLSGRAKCLWETLAWKPLLSHRDFSILYCP